MRKIAYLILLYVFISPTNVQSEENNDLLMRMYEKLEIMSSKMQDIINENQILLKKIEDLEAKQELLYQDLDKKISKIKSEKESSDSQLYSETFENILENKPKDPNETDISNQELIDSSKNNEGLTGDEIISSLQTEDNEESNVGNQDKYLKKNEIELYREAFQLIRNKDFKNSKIAFSAFLSMYPKSVYASNAQYWLAESVYALEDYDNAIKYFTELLSVYPKSSKVADAKLKVGFCLFNIKKWKEARIIFNDIVKDYPNTSLSKLASQKIQRMDIEGR